MFVVSEMYNPNRVAEDSCHRRNRPWEARPPTPVVFSPTRVATVRSPSSAAPSKVGICGLRLYRWIDGRDNEQSLEPESNYVK